MASLGGLPTPSRWQPGSLGIQAKRQDAALHPRLLSLKRESKKERMTQVLGAHLNCKVLTDLRGGGVTRCTEPVRSRQRLEVLWEESKCLPEAGLSSHPGRAPHGLIL